VFLITFKGVINPFKVIFKLLKVFLNTFYVFDIPILFFAFMQES